MKQSIMYINTLAFLECFPSQVVTTCWFRCLHLYCKYEDRANLDSEHIHLVITDFMTLQVWSCRWPVISVSSFKGDHLTALWALSSSRDILRVKCPCTHLHTIFNQIQTDFQWYILLPQDDWIMWLFNIIIWNRWKSIYIFSFPSSLIEWLLASKLLLSIYLSL
jgi:hypothetical protein